VKIRVIVIWVHCSSSGLAPGRVTTGARPGWAADVLEVIMRRAGIVGLELESKLTAVVAVLISELVDSVDAGGENIAPDFCGEISGN
jgi:hypothetical protein